MREAHLVAMAAVLQVAGCSLVFDAAPKDDEEADAARFDGDGAVVPQIDGAMPVPADANTSGIYTLTIIVTSDVGGQVSFSGGPLNGQFCNATSSPCDYMLAEFSAALLIASPNDFLGFSASGDCTADTSVFQRINVVMLGNCTVFAAFGDKPTS